MEMKHTFRVLHSRIAYALYANTLTRRFFRRANPSKSRAEISRRGVRRPTFVESRVDGYAWIIKF